MKPLPKQYDHKAAEKHWQHHWEEKRVYAWEEALPREQTFVIDTPPPTVSGTLHMGHIFSYTQADFVARYQRMSGKTVFYPIGFDDNGLPTERLVEKVKKIRATDMSREDFIRQCEGVAEEARTEFRHLFTSVALSVDWAQEYHTISEDCRRISQLSFLDLFHKNAAYRKLQPMLWDPVDQTAIAQAEVEDKELAGHFNDIYFEVVDADGQPLNRAEFGGRKLREDSDAEAIIWREGKSYIVIGTTRPELIPACVGIFFHPEDARYAGLKGKTAITPLFGVKVPVLEDDTVEPDKGTGIMMCCTFGDEADIAKWRKHDLPTRVILNKYGKIALDEELATRNSQLATQLQNLKAAAAREKILELLKESGDLIESRPITHAVKCAERSGAPLELLPTHQWFIRVLDQKEALKDKAAQCEWHPPYMKVRMDQWIDGLNWDWCISRQRYFGVPFPIWYVQKIENETNSITETKLGNLIRGTSYSGKIDIVTPDSIDLPINPLDRDLTKRFFEGRGFKYLGFDALNSSDRTNDSDVLDLFFEKDGERYIISPEADVMDTWATSSVSPQLSAHGISKAQCDDPARYAKLFPAHMRPQAHEIIRTWAFYTVVKAHLHENSIPWENLMISGWCLASDKTKMSKSKGNIVTPVALIEEKGADAVRYWASTSRLGADTAFSEDVLKIGRKLVTKIWNATQFAAVHLEKLAEQPASAVEEKKAGVITEALDLWILSRLKQTMKKATEEFERFEYSNARQAIEDFFWKDFCDNYLELVKARAYGENGEGKEGNAASSAAQRSAHLTLYHCLNALLRLFAPIVPHVTEELYSHLFEEEYAKLGSIHARGNWPNAADYPEEEAALASGIACVSVLNAVRKSKSERNMSIKYPIERITVAGADAEKLKPVLEDLKAAANAAAIDFAGALTDPTVVSEDGIFSLSIEFAAEKEAISAAG